jgi:hypothetical protein
VKAPGFAQRFRYWQWKENSLRTADKKYAPFRDIRPSKRSAFLCFWGNPPTLTGGQSLFHQENGYSSSELSLARVLL